MSWPMSDQQRDYIEILRKKQNISQEMLNRLCLDQFLVELQHLNVRQASGLIDGLKNGAFQRSLQQLAGQQVLL